MVRGKYGLGLGEVAVVAVEIGRVEVRVVASLAEFFAYLQPLRALGAAELVRLLALLPRGDQALVPLVAVRHVDTQRLRAEEVAPSFVPARFELGRRRRGARAGIVGPCEDRIGLDRDTERHRERQQPG
jgi:hypothetical protein